MPVFPKFEWKAEDVIRSGKTTRSNVEAIKNWVAENPNIPEICDEQIVLFLLSCNNVIEDTIVTVKAYFKHRYAAPEFFKDRFMENEEFRNSTKVCQLSASPKYTNNNDALIFAGLRDTNYWNYALEPSTKYIFMCLDAIIQNHPAEGLIIMFDMKGVGLMHLTRIKLSAVKKFFNFLQEGLPCQLRQIHIFNCTYIFDKILMIIKPFMKKELLEMLHTHQSSYDMNDFYEKFVPQEYLPAEYGGPLDSLQDLAEQTLERFKKLRTYFEDDEKQVALYKKVK